MDWHEQSGHLQLQSCMRGQSLTVLPFSCSTSKCGMRLLTPLASSKVLRASAIFRVLALSCNPQSQLSLQWTRSKCMAIQICMVDRRFHLDMDTIIARDFKQIIFVVSGFLMPFVMNRFMTSCQRACLPSPQTLPINHIIKHNIQVYVFESN